MSCACRGPGPLPATPCLPTSKCAAPTPPQPPPLLRVHEQGRRGHGLFPPHDAPAQPLAPLPVPPAAAMHCPPPLPPPPPSPSMPHRRQQLVLQVGVAGLLARRLCGSQQKPRHVAQRVGQLPEVVEHNLSRRGPWGAGGGVSGWQPSGGGEVRRGLGSAYMRPSLHCGGGRHRYVTLRPNQANRLQRPYRAAAQPAAQPTDTPANRPGCPRCAARRRRAPTPCA